MAGPRMLIICLCFIPLIYSYNIENRKFNQFGKISFWNSQTKSNHRFNLENQRFYAARLPSKFVPSYDNCIPVQAINELKCSILSNVELFYGLFESVCQRHQLCYACVRQKITRRHKLHFLRFLGLWTWSSSSSLWSNSSYVNVWFMWTKSYDENRLFNYARNSIKFTSTNSLSNTWNISWMFASMRIKFYLLRFAILIEKK